MARIGEARSWAVHRCALVGLASRPRRARRLTPRPLDADVIDHATSYSLIAVDILVAPDLRLEI